MRAQRTRYGSATLVKGRAAATAAQDPRGARRKAAVDIARVRAREAERHAQAAAAVGMVILRRAGLRQTLAKLWHRAPLVAIPGMSTMQSRGPLP